MTTRIDYKKVDEALGLGLSVRKTVEVLKLMGVEISVATCGKRKKDLELMNGGKQESKAGFICVYTNPILNGVVKIGVTSKAPYDTVKDLSSKGAAPCSYNVFYGTSVKDPRRLLSAVSQALDDYRVSPKRNFFKVDKVLAMNIINELKEYL